MKRIEPRPTRHTLIIIPANPLQSLQIAPTNISLKLQKLPRRNLKLLPIIFLLISKKLMPKNRIVINIDRLLFIHPLHDGIEGSYGVSWVNFDFLFVDLMPRAFFALGLTLFLEAGVLVSLFVVCLTDYHLAD